MSYKALLFCPDDKTARVVTQVLSELEFQVERCNEPFASVKKLMAEHFDALVVDCENDQNATLLFKSARNSGSNQTSLSVAVVEGQGGVAQAFRIGANLVLTKPINVEQSKGTLRVARGLLRKTDFTKAAFTPPSVARAAAVTDFKPASAPGIPASRPAITSLPAQPPPSVIPMASASVLEVEKEPEPQPEPAEAALLESMPDPVGPRNYGADPATAGGLKNYPWQPITRPAAEPVASAVRTSAEESRGSAQGAAAAPAPAKDVRRTEVSTTAAQAEPPLFSSFGGMQEEPASGSQGARKILIAAVVLLAAAGAGYVGWTRMHSGNAALTQKPPAAVQTQPVQTQAPASADMSDSVNSEPNGPSATEEAQSVEQAPDITLSTTDSASPTTDSVSSTPPPAKAAKPTPGVKTKQPAKETNPQASKNTSSLAGQAEAVNPNAHAHTREVVVVKNEHFTPVQQPAPVEEPAAPPALDVASNAEENTISGIVSAAPTNVPQPAPHMLKVSQGISQGLLVKKVPPVYPPQARRMGIQGAVEILANIGKDGNITSVKLVSGDKILALAALDAVKQWKYKAYYLDGQPVDFQTQITVNFKLP